jgi:hypothetical protein
VVRNRKAGQNPPRVVAPTEEEEEEEEEGGEGEGEEEEGEEEEEEEGGGGGGGEGGGREGEGEGGEEEEEGRLPCSNTHRLDRVLSQINPITTFIFYLFNLYN